MDKTSWDRLLYRNPQTNKYDYGHVLIMGGSEAMVGAPILTARAALRTGAGLVTIASPDKTAQLIDRDIEEIMTLSLPPWDRPEKTAHAIREFINKRQVSVLVIGPGLASGADRIIRTLIATVELPTVLDAEVFTALSDHLRVLKATASTNVILTPHSGEYARLIKNEPQYNTDSEIGLKRFAQDFNATVILKQHHTLAVSAKGEIYKNTTGNPGMATAGTGDVLTGIIGGILAQKVEPYEAAKMSVYLHGKAGDIAAQAKTEPGMVASDVIEAIPEALRQLTY